MAAKRQRSNGTWEFAFQKKGVLDRVYFTFDTEEEGDRYAEHVEALLARGVVPLEMSGVGIGTLQSLLERYELAEVLTRSDTLLLPALTKAIGKTTVPALGYVWVEDWVAKMKADGLAASTLKKRVGLLARAVDWAMRSGKLSLAANPLRLLPRGYATKGMAKELLWAGERDRRLESKGGQTEEGAIRKVLVKKEEHLLFDMALESAMRMREMFTLTMGQIDLARRTIFLEKTKNGDKRQVPISSVLLKELKPLVTDDDEVLLFPFWDGKEPLDAVTNRLSHLFSARFEKAGCADLRFHDLRHTAVCRLYERTTMSDVEISKITGHKDMRMLRRYANLRGSDLAAKMW